MSDAMIKRNWPILAVVGLLWGLPLGGQAVSVEPPLDGNGSHERNGFAVEVGVIGIGVSYARQLQDEVQIGIAVGAGASLGWMVLRDQFTAGEYGADGVSVELAHGDLLLRSSSRRRLQVEGGFRMAWVYHPPTEYETLLVGAQVTPLVRLGRFRIGPRMVIGTMTEEAGRSTFNIGLYPIAVRYEWTW